VRMQLRARKGYAEVAKSLGGLAKAKAEQRIKETETLAAVYGPKVVSEASADSGVTKLPQGTFLREWTSPAAWAGKPEQCTVKGTKISVVNAGGGNVVYSDLDLVREQDGSASVSWRRDATHTGYEVWSGPGRDITIRRWNSKAEKDAGKPASREGRIVWK
jgi:hypothetical protein